MTTTTMSHTTCPNDKTFQALVKHVESCTHCGRKWAGLRKDEPYCDEYQRLADEHVNTKCTCSE